MLQRDTHAAMTQWKGTVNVNDTGYIPDINRVLDAHLYSQRLKGQSVVLTFSAPLELISPPARLWKCYCNWDASWTGPSTTQEVCILNGVSMRLTFQWWPRCEVPSPQGKKKRCVCCFPFLNGSFIEWGSGRKKGSCFSYAFFIECRTKLW